ncbi:MAG: carbohydrate kinase [Clostridia bacterium]|nr:carbohydrate kinase [Clostridia bacterium]
MIFLGLDVGSTGCKCVAFSEEGVQTALAYSEYKTVAGYSDMDARDMAKSVFDVIAECASKVDAADVRAIAVTSFGESCVPIDRDGNPLAPFIMYTDKRGIAETDRLIDKLGYDNLMNITCQKPAQMYSLPKIMWTMENVPGVAQNVWKFLQVSDYVCYLLSGEAKVSQTLACRTMAYNVEKGVWDNDILAAAGIDASIMPEIVPCGSIVGDMTASAAEKLGLHTGVAVVNTSQDQIAAAIGAGVLDDGQAVDGTGSVECITPVFSKIIRNRDFPDHNFVCVPHAVSGKYATYAFNWAGGVLLKWFRDCFASYLKPEAAARGVSVYRMLDEMCPATPSDVIVVPHHMGAGGTPDMVADAKGTFAGMTMATTMPDIYRAVMEGLTFEIRYNIEWLDKFGIEINSLSATGGGASSPIWLKLKADILGRDITPVKGDQAGAAGCAMAAAVAVGKFKDLHEAAEVFVRHGETCHPDLTMKAFYDEKYERYKEIRNSVLHSWDK